MTRKNIHIFGNQDVGCFAGVAQVGGAGPTLPLVAMFARDSIDNIEDIQGILDHPDTTVLMFTGHSALFGLLYRLGELGLSVSRQMEGLDLIPGTEKPAAQEEP